MPKRILSGKVVRTSDKTIAVLVESRRKHPLYNKKIKVHKKYLVHNPANIKFDIGRMVNIMECRPISSRKHFCIMESKVV